MSSNEAQLLTLKQTAEIFNMSERTIYNKVRPGSKEIPFPITPIKIGRLWRFRKSWQIDQFLILVNVKLNLDPANGFEISYGNDWENGHRH